MSPVDRERIKNEWERLQRPDHAGGGDSEDVVEFAEMYLPALVNEVEELQARIRTNEWQASFQSLYQETDMKLRQVQADLAMARAGLKAVYERLSGGKEGNLENEVDEALHIVERALSRLGTGEALAAVREAQEVLDRLHGITWDEGAYAILKRLRAVFGEKPWVRGEHLTMGVAEKAAEER